MKMSTLEWIAWVLVVVGAINWGLWGFFGYNLVMAIFGMYSGWVYDLVGLAGLYFVWTALTKKKK